jgi:hypothetical protein
MKKGIKQQDTGQTIISFFFDEIGKKLGRDGNH